MKFTQLAALLLLGVVVGQEDICDKDKRYLDSCLKKLPSLLSHDDNMGIPSTKKAVEQACNAFKTGMECFDLYASTCLSGEKQKVMNHNVAGARHTFSYLCNDPAFQAEYLQYNSCYKKVSKDWDACAKRFLEKVNRSHTRVMDICCANDAFLDCVYEVGEEKCQHEAAVFLRKIAGISANVRVYDAKCKPKESSQERCSAADSHPALLVIASFLLLSLSIGSTSIQ